MRSCLFTDIQKISSNNDLHHKSTLRCILWLRRLSTVVAEIYYPCALCAVCCRLHHDDKWCTRRKQAKFERQRCILIRCFGPRVGGAEQKWQNWNSAKGQKHPRNFSRTLILTFKTYLSLSAVICGAIMMSSINVDSRFQFRYIRGTAQHEMQEVIARTLLKIINFLLGQWHMVNVKMRLGPSVKNYMYISTLWGSLSRSLIGHNRPHLLGLQAQKDSRPSSPPPSVCSYQIFLASPSPGWSASRSLSPTSPIPNLSASSLVRGDCLEHKSM